MDMVDMEDTATAPVTAVLNTTANLLGFNAVGAGEALVYVVPADLIGPPLDHVVAADDAITAARALADLLAVSVHRTLTAAGFSPSAPGQQRYWLVVAGPARRCALGTPAELRRAAAGWDVAAPLRPLVVRRRLRQTTPTPPVRRSAYNITAATSSVPDSPATAAPLTGWLPDYRCGCSAAPVHGRHWWRNPDTPGETHVYQLVCTAGHDYTITTDGG